MTIEEMRELLKELNGISVSGYENIEKVYVCMRFVAIALKREEEKQTATTKEKTDTE